MQQWLAVDGQLGEAALERLQLMIEHRAAHDKERAQPRQPLCQRVEVLLLNLAPAGGNTCSRQAQQSTSAHWSTHALL